MNQPDNTSSWFADGWKVASAIGTAFAVILWWLWNQMVARLVTFGSRLDTLERTAVTREELDKKFAEQKEERKAMHLENKGDIREARDYLQRIEKKLDDAEPGVIASELQRAQKDIQELRDWKHQVDPFIERRVAP